MSEVPDHPKPAPAAIIGSMAFDGSRYSHSVIAPSRTSASLARLRRSIEGEGASRPQGAARPTRTVPARAAQS